MESQNNSTQTRPSQDNVGQQVKDGNPNFKKKEERVEVEDRPHSFPAGAGAKEERPMSDKDKQARPATDKEAKSL